MSESQIVMFTLTSLLIIMSPGQDMVLVMSRGISQGAKAGIVTAAGVSIGLLGHTILAAIGLGAILQASDLAFTVMKYMGATYLVYLGIKLFMSSPFELSKPTAAPNNLRVPFTQGAVSNLSNPKIAIFYFAYLPQFIAPENNYPTETLLVLGIAFALITFVVKVPIGYLAGTFSGWIKARPTVQKWLNRTSGSVLIGLGVRLAFESHSKADL